jgi:transposase
MLDKELLISLAGSQNIEGLSPAELTAVIAQLLSHVAEQDQHIGQQRQRLDSAEQSIKWRDVKIEKLTFQLARLKRWKFGANSERMSAEQRELFAEALAADEASLEAQLAALRAQAAAGSDTGTASSKPAAKRKPKRERLPDHLPRVDTRVEPENTTCGCGQAMERMGEDVSERLDVTPAQFIVQRQIRGKWVCRCCERLVQEPAAVQIFENGMPTPGLQAHTVISHFVDHLPYYRQEQINARAGVHTPRATLAAWGGQTGAQLMPLFEVHRDFVLGSRVLHADETTLALLDPGAGKTKTAYMWAYARGAFEPERGVVYDFQPGRGGKYAFEFLRDWSGTLVCDEYAGYHRLLAMPGRVGAGCFAHARRKFETLVKANASEIANQALQRIAWLYRVEADASALTTAQRLEMRHNRSKPLCEELHTWLLLERRRVPDGSGIAGAIDYSLNHWPALTQFLRDGNVPIDNNHLENQMRPWAVGRKNWLFIGSELAGERAAIIMSLVQSAKLNGADPWLYLRDVLTRLPTQLNSRIDELLPHRWKPTAL